MVVSGGRKRDESGTVRETVLPLASQTTATVGSGLLSAWNFLLRGHQPWDEAFTSFRREREGGRWGQSPPPNLPRAVASVTSPCPLSGSGKICRPGSPCPSVWPAWVHGTPGGLRHACHGRMERETATLDRYQAFWFLKSICTCHDQLF